MGAGIGLGVVGLISLVGGFCFWRRRQGKRQEPQASQSLDVEQHNMPQPMPYYDCRVHKTTPVAEMFVPTGTEPEQTYEKW